MQGGVAEECFLNAHDALATISTRVELVTVIVSWVLFQTTVESVHTLKEYYKLIEAL